MRIMTQNAEVLSEQIQPSSFAQEMMDQEITLIALKDCTRSSIEYLSQSLQELGEQCTWVWFPDPVEGVHDGKGTAILCLGRGIRCVDQFSLTRGNDATKQPAHMAFGIQMEGSEDWFYCISQNPTDNFQEQWKQLNGCIVSKRLCSTVWLLGMQPYRGSIYSGSWVETADGDIWCSRNQMVQSYRIENYYQSSRSEKGTVVVEVKE